MKEDFIPCPKPTKKIKRKKGVNRQKKTPVAKLKRIADKLAGELCRSRGKCEKCGTIDNLQWAHIISRTYHVIRWDMENCFCLCHKCHFLFTNRPDTWIAWLMENHTERYLSLIKKKNVYIKIDRAFMEDVISSLQIAC